MAQHSNAANQTVLGWVPVGHFAAEPELSNRRDQRQPTRIVGPIIDCSDPVHGADKHTLSDVSPSSAGPHTLKWNSTVPRGTEDILHHPYLAYHHPPAVSSHPLCSLSHPISLWPSHSISRVVLTIYHGTRSASCCL